MKKTTVVNCKREEYDILIDRKTPYGNPFVVGKDGDRKTVIKKHKDWLSGKKFKKFLQKRRKYVLQRIPLMQGERLGWWCDPSPCHGDTYAELADAYKEKE